MAEMSPMMIGAMFFLMIAGMLVVMVILHRRHTIVAGKAGHHGAHDGLLFLIVTRLLKILLRLGAPLGPMVLLTVRGRKTGLPRTLPVDVFEHQGRSFLVSTHGAGNSDWVRNLRSVGTGKLTRGLNKRTFSAIELSQEAAGKVLKEVLGPRLALPLRGFVLRRTLAIAPDASPADFIQAAQIHPVFELTDLKGV